MRDADVRDADVRDADLVASIVAREPDGLTAAYDRYAPGLYAYCHCVLGDPGAACDAVQDTFIIAASELSRLGDPRQFRPWLYAVARNECRRLLRSPARSARSGKASEANGDTADDGGADADTAELRAAVGAAFAGLSATNREIIQLNVRSGLDGPDLADALGVSQNRADSMAARPRHCSRCRWGRCWSPAPGGSPVPSWPPC